MPAAIVDADRAEKPLTATQRRVVDAALRLFGDHGISGTSLQMIADEIGVTKAAVYHQFRTKDDIIVASTARAGRSSASAASTAASSTVPWSGISRATPSWPATCRPTSPSRTSWEG